MKLSVENEIARYPSGQLMNYPPKDVYGTTFHYYHVGGGVYVWRSDSTPTIEVGHKGGGGTYYSKVSGIIADHQYPSMREAAIAGVKKVAGLNFIAPNVVFPRKPVTSAWWR